MSLTRKREIKFRAWIKSVNAMSDWDTILKECDRFSLLYDPNFELMQFTGLKDKNGKEIYEGDIVRFKHGEQNKDEFYEKVEVVSFWRGSFCLGSNSLHDWYTDKDGNINERLSHFQQTINRIDFYYRDFDLGVIGNIYENKDLLK